VVRENELDGLGRGLVAGLVLAGIAVAAARDGNRGQDRTGQGPGTHIQMMIDAAHFDLLFWSRDRLFLSPKTLEGHVGNIFRKLGIGDAPNYHRRVVAVLTFLRAPGVS
jgi:hypothetical protein